MRACSVASDSVIPWTVAHQDPLSAGLSQHDYWGRWPLGGLPDPGIELVPPAPALAG